MSDAAAYRSQFEEAPRGQIWDNLGTKIINNSKEKNRNPCIHADNR